MSAILQYPQSQPKVVSIKASSLPHFVESDEPNLHEGGTLTAVCGAQIPKAKLHFMWDEVTMGQNWREVIRFGQFCGKCLNATISGRYVYGAKSGREEYE